MPAMAGCGHDPAHGIVKLAALPITLAGINAL
jgi:hypothetical protein